MTRSLLVIVFCVIAPICSQSADSVAPEHERAARDLLSEASSLVRQLPEYERNNFFEAIAMEQVHLNDFKAAADTANEGYPFGTQVLCEIGHRMDEHSSDEISATASLFTKQQGNDTYYDCVGEKYLELGRVADAEEISKRIPSPEVRNDLNSLILAYKATKGSWRESYQNAPADAHTPNAEFNLALSANDFGSALSIAANDQIKVFSVRCAQAQVAAKNKDLTGAKQFFQMAVDSLKSEDQRQKDAMKYFVVAYEAEYGFFDDALALAGTIEDAYNGPKAKLSLAGFLAQKGEFERASAVAQTIRRPKENNSGGDDPSANYESEAWQLIARAQTNAGKPSDALVTLDKIHDEYADLSGSVSFEKAYALSVLGRFEDTRQVLPNVDIGSYDDEKVRAYAVVSSEYCHKHTVSQCAAFAHSPGTGLTRVATMIGAAQGLIRETKEENPVPIYVH